MQADAGCKVSKKHDHPFVCNIPFIFQHKIRKSAFDSFHDSSDQERGQSLNPSWLPLIIIQVEVVAEATSPDVDKAAISKMVPPSPTT